jgi:hypothetical protein
LGDLVRQSKKIHSFIMVLDFSFAFFLSSIPTNIQKEVKRKTWQLEIVFLRSMKQHPRQFQEFHPYNEKQLFLKVKSKTPKLLRNETKMAEFQAKQHTVYYQGRRKLDKVGN